MLKSIIKTISNNKNFLIYIIILCSITYVTNVLNISFNADEVSRYSESYMNAFTLGRYSRLLLIYLLKLLSMDTTVPFFSFLVLVISFFVSLVIIHDVLEIKGISKYILSGLVIVNGALCEQLQYYTDYVYLAFGLVSVSFSFYYFKKYLLSKVFFDKNVLLTILFAIFSTAITQYYYVYIASLFFILLFNRAFDNNKYIKKDIIKYLFSIIIIFILYFFILKIICFIFNIKDISRISYTLSNYLNYKFILYRIFKAYAIVPALVFKNYAGLNTSLITKISILIIYIITFFSIINIIVFKKTNKFNKFYFVFCLFISPFIINSFVFFEETTSIRTTFSLCLFFYLFYIIINKACLTICSKSAFQIFIILILLIIIPNIYFINGTNYFNYLNNLHQQQFYSSFVSAIRNADSYSVDKKVIFITNTSNDSNKLFNTYNLTDYYNSLDYAFLDKIFPASSPSFDALLSPHAFVPSINRFGGYKFKSASKDEEDRYIRNHDVEGMPIYPDDGSIVVDGEYIVVKLG